MDLHDLVPDMDAVLEWEEQVAQMCPVISGRNGEKPTERCQKVFKTLITSFKEKKKLGEFQS